MRFKAGSKVKCNNKNGYESDQEKVNKFLSLDEVYTVEHMDIYGFHTDVYLKEIPNIKFNSVMFDLVEEQ